MASLTSEQRRNRALLYFLQHVSVAEERSAPLALDDQSQEVDSLWLRSVCAFLDDKPEAYEALIAYRLKYQAADVRGEVKNAINAMVADGRLLIEGEGQLRASREGRAVLAAVFNERKGEPS